MTPTPYPSEQPGGFWSRVEAEEAALSQQVGRPFDPARLRYIARMGYSLGAGMSEARAELRHLAELKGELGITLTPEEQAEVASPGLDGLVPYPDEQTYWAAFEATERTLYATPPPWPMDYAAGRWPARTGYDIATGLDPASARAKHLYELAVALGHTPPRPIPVPRSPLVFPTCGSCPAPDSFDKTLPWAPPVSRDYLRGNFWGIPVYVGGVPLPFVPGITSSKHPERFLSYLFGL